MLDYRCLNMKKLFLTAIIFLIGGVYFNTFAQEELYWKFQQYQKAEQSRIQENQVQYLDQSYMGEEYLALQTEQKNPENTQQKDPENQLPPVIERMEEESQQENIQPEETVLLKPQMVSPDRSQTSPQPALKQIQKTGDLKEAEQDDSVLEFNFLYFIIHKFKLSDILE